MYVPEKKNFHRKIYLVAYCADEGLTIDYFANVQRFFDFFFFCYNKGVDRRENAYEELAILMYGAQKMFVCVVRIESFDYIGPGLEQQKFSRRILYSSVHTGAKIAVTNKN